LASVHGGGPPSLNRCCQRVSHRFPSSKHVLASVAMWSSCWQPRARRAFLSCAHRRRFATEHRRAACHSNPKFTATVDPYPNSPWAYLWYILAHLQNPPFFPLSHQSTGIHRFHPRRSKSPPSSSLPWLAHPGNSLLSLSLVFASS
jgi:hypothetical protein